MGAYLTELTIRLATGVGQLDEKFRNHYVRFVCGQQHPDGGFGGRQGASDLYYTSFALRGLALCGELTGSVAEGAAGYLRARLASQVPIVDFMSLIYGASLLELSAGINLFAESNPSWRTAVAEKLETFRRVDGGYAKGPEGEASSTYHSFLVVLCQQLIEAPLPDPDQLAKFILSQRREDGGFVEIRAMRRSGTNPTAAAIGTLQILEQLEQSTCEGTIDFLLDMQTDEGGLRANTRIPIADLLSTFTGLLTLADLGALNELDTDFARRYIQSLRQADGGFLGAAWDQQTDVEYSFYGLGALALLGN